MCLLVLFYLFLISKYLFLFYYLLAHRFHSTCPFCFPFSFWLISRTRFIFVFLFTFIFSVYCFTVFFCFSFFLVNLKSSDNLPFLFIPWFLSLSFSHVFFCLVNSLPSVIFVLCFFFFACLHPFWSLFVYSIAFLPSSR